MGFIIFLVVIVVIAALLIAAYNGLVRLRVRADSSWSDIDVQLKRRHDLIPNLVNTVKGYAEHEQSTLEAVTNARAQVGKITLTTDDLNDEAKMKAFQQAQGELSGALSRLMAVSENYPNLKADSLFQTLQAQLEGTENRIAVARNRYISSVQDYNVLVRSFPQNLTAKMFGYSTKANFTVENEKQISTAPTVDFGKPAAPPAQPPKQPQN